MTTLPVHTPIKNPIITNPIKIFPATLPPQYEPIKELGVFDQLPADVQKQLTDMSTKNLTAAVKAKAEKAMADELAKPETQDKLMAEVRALGDSVVKCDEAFERVRVGLGKVDSNNYKDKNGRPIPKFQPRWVGYQKVCSKGRVISSRQS
jgi:hypothetical protein